MTLEQLWQEYNTNIRGFLYSRVSNPDDVDDLLQEIMIKVHKNLGTLISEDSLKSWLFQITQNTIIDFYRKKGRSNDFSHDEFLLDPEDQTITHELAECIKPFIQKLPPDNAALIEAIDITGQSQKEYSQINGINYSTLKSKVKKSRDMLLKTFNDCCHLSFDSYGRVIDYELKSKTCNNS